MSLSSIRWPTEPYTPSPGTLAVYASVRRAGRQSAHAAIVTAIRKMLANGAEFDRVEPGLAEMLPLDRAEHTADLWRRRLEVLAHPSSAWGRSDATNLRAARVAAWIAARSERHEMRIAAE